MAFLSIENRQSNRFLREQVSKDGKITSYYKWLLACSLLFFNSYTAGEYYNIPSQSFNTALKTIAQKYGLQIFFSHKITSNLKSNAVIGDFNSEQALRRMLQGSGLTYKKLNKKVFIIIRKKAPPTTVVNTPTYHAKIEEVVITSRKHSENIKKAPLSVAAFTEKDIEQANFSELPELSHIIPNFTIVPSPPISGNSAAAAIYIRGIGQLDFTINVDPGVGTYVDGVYLARSVGGVIDLIDLDRIEVLRGPQGTLFGRNTIGGAIRLISKAPSPTPSSTLIVTVGSDQRKDIKGLFNAPLFDNLLSKVSVLRRDREGYVIDGNGSDLGNDNSISIRSQLLWQATDNFDVHWIIDGLKDRENGSANTALNLFSSGRIPDIVNNALQGEARLAGCQPELLDSSRLCFGPAWLTRTNKTESTFLAKSNNDIIGVSMTLNYDTDLGTLTSITAKRNLESIFQRDSDHTPYNVFATYNDQNQTQISQELQWLGNNSQQTLQWVTGVYYLKEDATELTRVFLPDSSGIATNGIFDHQVQNINWSVYGETIYDVNELLHLTVGTRYTVEKKHFASQQVFVFPDKPDTIIRQILNEPGRLLQFKELTKKITLSANWTQYFMSYLTLSDGFKSGGFSARNLAPPPDLRATIYEPEYVTQYEVGTKYHNKNNTFLVNAAAFYSDYDDIQISTNPNITNNATIIQNAAKATIVGMELEFKLYPTLHWLIEGGIGYLDATYKMLDNDVTIDLGNDFAWVPQWSGSFAISYPTQLQNGVAVTPRLSVSYQSETQGTAENETDVVQSSYSKVDFAIFLNTTPKNWLLSLGVTNLTDKKYLISANQNQALGYSEGVFARGREWHLKMSKSF